MDFWPPAARQVSGGGPWRARPAGAGYSAAVRGEYSDPAGASEMLPGSAPIKHLEPNPHGIKELFISRQGIPTNNYDLL